MINKNNITAYIRFLYKMKYGTEAPAELVSKWSTLHEDELYSNLTQLYTHWNFSAEKVKDIEAHFLNAGAKPVANPVATAREPISQMKVNPPPVNLPKKKSGLKIASYIFWPMLIVGSLYIGYQYLQYQKMHTIYTLTQNVSIRDEQGKQMALFSFRPNDKTKTYTKLQVLDNDIYPLSLDSSSNKYDFRKVLFEKADFISFLKNDYAYGFVNANYVIEDEQEFVEYQRIFGKFQDADNNRLKLSQRKIIYHILQQSEKYRNSYLLSSCKNSKKNFAGFLSNEIVENTRYQIIAKLEDGYFYSFVGDHNSSEYNEPQRIQLDGNDCNADLLFRFISAQSGFKVYNCFGAAQNIRLNMDENKMISSFETIITEPEPEPVIEEEGGGILEDLFG